MQLDLFEPRPVYTCGELQSYVSIHDKIQYFNTTHLTGEQLTKRSIRAGTQNAAILEFFQANPGRSYTPFEVKKALFRQIGGLHNLTPITSIRRAISTLTDMGYLVMTDELREGEYGAVNHCWKLI